MKTRKLGLTLRILNEQVARNATGRKRSSNRASEIEIKMAGLEVWFQSNSAAPSPTSEVAATMRHLLPQHPDLSFVELRGIARQVIEIGKSR